MTAALLARQMLDGLGETARGELVAVLAELSKTGHGDLVSVFEGLLEGRDLAATLNLPEGTVPLLYAQAHARFNAGDVPDALAMFQALAVLAPTVKDHWLGLGVCLRLSGLFAGARLSFATALDLVPDCPAAVYHLAELSLVEGQLAASTDLLRRFAALPDSALKQRLAGEAQRLAAAVEARQPA